MKRIISILLAILLLSGYANVYATEENIDEKAVRSLKILQTIGLVSIDYDAEVLDFDLGVTRAELATITNGVFNAEGSTVSGLYYHDVSEEFWAYSSIGYLVSAGALTVPEEKMFYPERVSTEAEAYKVVLSVLGLGGIIGKGEAWPQNVYMAAATANITHGVVNDNKLTYAELFKILHNAVLIELPEMSGFTNSGSFSMTYGDETFLEKNYDVYAARGTVESVEKISTKKSIGTDGIIVIEGLELELNGFECKEYIGTQVEYYYKHNPLTETNTLLWIESRNKSTVVSINHKDNDINYNSKTRTLTYFENNTKKKNIEISDDVSIIYNDRYLESGHDAVLSSHINYMYLIDSTGGKDYNLLMIYSYDNRIIGSIDIEKEYIYTMGNEEKIELNAFDDYIIQDTNGEQLEVSDLKAGSVISVYETKSNESIRIIYSEDTIIGKISSKTKDSSGYGILTIDEEKYYTEYNYKGNDNWTSSTAKFFIDHLGFIVNFDYDLSGNIGLLIEYREDRNEDRTRFEIYTTNGKFLKLYSTEKLTIDGTRAKGFAHMDYLLGGKPKQEQLIVYELNDAGDVKKIDTIRSNSDGENGIERITAKAELKNDPSKSAIVTRTSFSPKMFPTSNGEVPYITDSSTIVISIPGSFGSASECVEKDFIVKRGSDLGWDKSYSCDGYKIGEADGTVDVLLVYNKNWRSDRTYMLVDKSFQELNIKDDESVTVLEGYNKDGEIKCMLSPGDTTNIQKGDFIELQGVGNEDYYAVTQVYRPSEKSPEFKIQQMRADVMVVGYVCANKNGKIFVSEDPTSGNSDDYDDVFDLSSMKLHICDADSGEIISNVTHDEIRTLEKTNKADRIVIYCQQMNAKAAVIYR